MSVESLPFFKELQLAALMDVIVSLGLTITNGVLSADGITPADEVTALENNADLADVITAFNALLSALQTAGLMETTT